MEGPGNDDLVEARLAALLSRDRAGSRALLLALHVDLGEGTSQGADAPELRGAFEALATACWSARVAAAQPGGEEPEPVGARLGADLILASSGLDDAAALELGPLLTGDFEEERRAAASAGEAAPVSLSVGVALGGPGLDVAGWIAVARDGLAAARSAGGDRAVHSELYDLYARGRSSASSPAGERGPTGEAAADDAPPRLREAWIPRANFAAVRGRLADRRDHRAAVAELEAALAARERAALDARRAGEVEARRVAKLTARIAELEQEAAGLRARLAADPGLASRYASVQGLDPAEPAAPLKRELIRRLFDGNRRG